MNDKQVSSSTPDDRIAELHEACRAAGIVCSDEKWLGAVHHYHFRCHSGHEWVRRGDAQIANPRCPTCVRTASAIARRKLDNLQRLHEVARSHGGDCLSSEYTGVADRFAFRCASGHEWETQAYTVLNGSWCKLCRHEAMRRDNLLPEGLSRLQRLARDRGGECLSGEYLGSRVPYRFRCAEGHEWEKLGSTFIVGQWCGICREEVRRRQLEANAQEMAGARGGRCLGEHFINTKKKLRWLCDRGHEWHAPLGRIREGHWCPECANMALISNRKSKARRRYEAVGTDLLSETSTHPDTVRMPALATTLRSDCCSQLCESSQVVPRGQDVTSTL